MRVAVTGAGGSMGFDVAHCLAAAGHEVVGCDADPTGLLFAARGCHETRRLPKAHDPGFVDAVRALPVDHVFACPDAEVAELAVADALVHTPIPHRVAVAVTLDKYATYQTCREAAQFPRTYLWRHDPFHFRGGPWWVRPCEGAGGRAARRCASGADVAAWVSLNPDVSAWVLHDYLPGENLTVNMMWWRGECVASACARRDGYICGHVAAVTGDVSAMTTVERPDACHAASWAVVALPGTPHGLFGVDLKCDAHNAPCVTEINPRLSGRPRLYEAAGVNLPALWLDMVEYGRPLHETRQRHGVRLLRRVDQPPVIEGGP